MMALNNPLTIDTGRPKLLVKNSFLHIDEDLSPFQRADRRRTKTAPGPQLNSIVDSILDSDDEDKDDDFEPALSLQGFLNTTPTASRTLPQTVPPTLTAASSAASREPALQPLPPSESPEPTPALQPPPPSVSPEPMPAESTTSHEPALQQLPAKVATPLPIGSGVFSEPAPHLLPPPIPPPPMPVGPAPATNAASQKEFAHLGEIGWPADGMRAPSPTLSADEEADAAWEPAAPQPQDRHDGPVKGAVWSLSQDSCGCWAVQQALEAAKSEESRCELADELRGHVWQATHDLYANYVLQKFIMLMHPRHLEFMIDELMMEGQGAASMASRNKYGCRVVQRLLEYCSHVQVARLVDDLLADAVNNCRHRYSKYAMQCLLEHGTVKQYRQLVQILALNIGMLGADMHACFVVGKALSAGIRADQVMLAQAVYSEPGLIKRMSMSKQGHFVVKLVLQALESRDPQGQTLQQAFDVHQEHEQMCVNTPLTSLRAVNPAGAGASSRPTAPVAVAATGPQRTRRRGAGGGAAAQAEAEARDLIESLRAACKRRGPARIAKVLSRVMVTFATIEAPEALRAQAAQACEEARQLIGPISVDGRMFPNAHAVVPPPHLQHQQWARPLC